MSLRAERTFLRRYALPRPAPTDDTGWNARNRAPLSQQNGTLHTASNVAKETVGSRTRFAPTHLPLAGVEARLRRRRHRWVWACCCRRWGLRQSLRTGLGWLNGALGGSLPSSHQSAHERHPSRADQRVYPIGTHERRGQIFHTPELRRCSAEIDRRVLVGDSVVEHMRLPPLQWTGPFTTSRFVRTQVGGRTASEGRGGAGRLSPPSMVLPLLHLVTDSGFL